MPASPGPLSSPPDGPDERQAAVSIELHPLGPFRLDLTAWALRRRARNRIDIWDGDTYRRALVVDGQPLAVEVTQLPRRRLSTLTLTISGLPGTLSENRVALARQVVETGLGLRVDLRPFYRLARRDPHLAGLVTRFRGLKPPRFPSLFEALVNAVACQQLSLEVGITLLNRLTDAHGIAIAGVRPPLAAFPEPAALAVAFPADLRQLGFSNRKAETLVRLAVAVLDGSLDELDLSSLPRAEASAALQGLSGIGRWSAEYALLRGLGRLEVYPGDDVGARNKLRGFLGLSEPPDYATVNQLTAPWAPFQGMVYFHLLLQGLAERGTLAP